MRQVMRMMEMMHPDTSAHGHHNYEVYAMRDDGSNKTRITYKAGFDGLQAKGVLWGGNLTVLTALAGFTTAATPAM